MKKAIAIFCLAVTSVLTAFAQKPIHCLIKTSLGDIAIELYPTKAPVSVANFMKYVDKHAYNGSSFFRVCTPVNEATRKVKIQVIQGGNMPDSLILDSIKIETTKSTGLLHQNGTLSMARSGPNSATSQFFICINAQPALDYGGARNPDGQGFAAFGKVTAGMDVVKKIQSQKDDAQYLVEPVKVYEINRVE
ncbi:peptidylprolyl isomerase [Mucilaginibacter dorajii]|uniref:Peptidyl-prolyl cis-trans isomerase n=1 Tax=Mucilaginibacter dorajii TaxID=692994 RepID=A0ABP7R316_9SPHI|nr:peptidylprolyl isomerase [Mucilaginibacter dorajii]MCS3732084.1 peptidyl-prolyl cis-trans isomerase A (cyclophilin A) [Mucilaginibacter dorajii]